MEPKSFWKSRKLAYALGTFLAALVVALLPTVVEVDQETLDALETMLPLIFGTGIAALAGHTLTDIAHQWREGVQAKNLQEAAQDLLEILFDLLDEEEGEPEVPPAEVSLGDVAHS